MADVSTLYVNGETYDIKDATARSAVSNKKIWTGTCPVVATNVAKGVTLDDSTGFALAAGVFVLVYFPNGNSTTNFVLNVNNLGNTQVATYVPGTGLSTSTTAKQIAANEWVLFVYDGSRWIMLPTGCGIETIYAPKSSPALTGTPTAPTAASGTNTTQIATTAFVQAAVQAAAGGAVAFQGVINSNTAISGLSSYTAGWYWVVGTAGTYVGQTCEVGDMIFCKTSNTTYSASDFNVVQVNVTGLGALAYKDSASGTVTPASKSITQLSSAGTMTSISASYANEILSLTWTNGTAPQGAAVSVADTTAVNVTVS